MKKCRIILLISAVLVISSVPAVSTYGAESEISTETSVSDNKVYITENWLTDAVASQAGKEIDKLSISDFNNVTVLDLHDERIEEGIPEEIRLLKNLNTLNLNSCRLTGPIPEELGELENLKNVNLGDNKLTDIPDNMVKKISEGKYDNCEVRGNKFDLVRGFYFLNGKWVYLDKNGDVLTGTQEIDGVTYIFSDDGTLRQGLQEENGQSYFYEKNGLAKNKWIMINNKWYYFNENGVMQKNTLLTIDGKKYLVNADGSRVTGMGYIGSNKYYFGKNGDMQYGFIKMGNNQYYFAPNTGEMAFNKAVMINGSEYRFDANGIMIRNRWINDNKYIGPDGKVQTITSNYSHSNFNFRLFKYMTNAANQASVDKTAVSLHGGRTDNNCVYFASESMRRIGLNIPNATANTYQLENLLKGMGFASCSNLSYLKPGDIVFTKNYSHVYIFMGWAENGYAYIVDNQKYNYDNQILHKRAVYVDTSISDRATHFFYYPN